MKRRTLAYRFLPRPTRSSSMWWKSYTDGIFDGLWWVACAGVRRWRMEAAGARVKAAGGRWAESVGGGWWVRRRRISGAGLTCAPVSFAEQVEVNDGRPRAAGSWPGA